MTRIEIDIFELKSGGIYITLGCLTANETDAEKEAAQSFRLVLEDKAKQAVRESKSQPAENDKGRTVTP